MSLKVWLPLNGNTKNKGLIRDNYITSSSSVFTKGNRCGEALSSGEIALSAEGASKLFNNSELSICFWIYVKSGGTSKQIFGGDSVDSYNNRKFALYQYPTINDLHWSWMNDTANKTFAVGILEGVLPSNTWTHVCVTYKNPYGKIYINGNLVKEFEGVSNSSSFSYVTRLIHNNSARVINDLRVYDNCISKKEIQEIYKTLIMHIPLDDPYEEYCNNLYSGNNARGDSSWNWGSCITKNKLVNEAGYNYSFSYTGTGTENWPNFSFPTYPFTAGKLYTINCKIRVNSCKNNTVWQLRHSRTGNDYYAASAVVVNSSLADSAWREYTITQVLNSTNDFGATSPRIEFYANGMKTSGEIFSANFDIKDVQVIESDHYLPFRLNNLGKVCDSSGSGYNGTITSQSMSPKYSSSKGIRNKGCFSFDGAENFIKFSKVPNLYVYTISVFFYSTSSTNTQCIYANRTSAGSGLAIFIINGEKLRIDTCAGSSGQDMWETGIDTIVNTWYHIAVVVDGSSIKLYLNGVLKGTHTISYTNLNTLRGLGTIGASYEGEFTNIGNFFKGYISDFRIYGTALNENDILELYKVSSNVCSNGTLLCGEAIETNKTSIAVKKKRVIESSSYSELTSDTEVSKFKLYKNGNILTNEIIEN